MPACIIDQEVKSLIRQIDKNDDLLQQLVKKVAQNCKKPEVQQRYRLLAEKTGHTLTPYPVDRFAKAFDPVEEEEEFFKAWATHGFVVGKSLVSSEQCSQMVNRINDVLQTLSKGTIDLKKPQTFPVDEKGLPCISRGFFELYHDDSIAQIRQSIRLWLHHVLIWGRADLWSSFDRFGVKTQDEDNAPGLPLHVDQNPLVHPHFKTTQGVLALVDCPTEQGTFVAVAGSRGHFTKYENGIKKHDPAYRGEYVEAGWDPELNHSLMQHAQPIPLKAGDFVSWDSRTTHGNSPNLLNSTRYVAYISYGPTAEAIPGMREHRLEALQTGIGQNIREALMHASKPPRCSLAQSFEPMRQKERLTYLGKLLYGQSLWSSAL